MIIKSEQKTDQTKTKPRKNQKKELNLEQIKRFLNKIEDDVQHIRNILFDSDYQYSAKKLILSNPKTKNVIEGVFDGSQMIDSSGKKYQVPENYASKSKLVEGDVLKLTITIDGTYIFKQIGPIERKKLIGILGQQNERYFVNVDEKKYNVLTASVTYFKAKPGDKLTVVLPKNKESQWASIENVIG